MRAYPYFRFTVGIALLGFIVLIIGCSVAVRPRNDGVPPIDDDYYYEEPAYDSYYNATPPPPGYRYDYSSSYDPWTMGTYYEHYSGPARSDKTSETSSRNSGTATNQIQDTRPITRQPSVTPGDQQTKAPINETPRLKRDRTSAREREKDRSQAGNTSATIEKTRRESRRSVFQQPQTNQSPNESKTRRQENRTQNEQQKTRRSSRRDQIRSDDKDEEEDKEKNKVN